MANDPNTETAEAPAAAKESKRKAVSKRILLDANGAETDDIIGAGGFRYESLSEPGTSITAMFSGEDALPQASILALAAFGGTTLAGNVTNTIRNGEPKAGGPQTEREALEAWLKELREGNWTRPTGEVDPGMGLLAQAVARHFDSVKPLASGEKRGETEISKIKDWLAGLDKETRAGWRKDPKVAAHIARINLEKKEAAAANAGEAATPDVPADL
jgi:hypothetical protein